MEKQWKVYQCTKCGNAKMLLINHDHLPEVWERCTEDCMWTSKEGPALFSVDGKETGFRKTKYRRVK